MPEGDRGIRKVTTMRRSKWLLFLAALALVAAACGYSDVSSDTTAAPSGGGEDVGGAAHGQELFKSTCSACHGQNAEGIDGLGTQLSNSDFVQSLSNAELILFISAGRSTTDPDNTTGVDMPPKGGDSSLTETDLADIVDYLRTLQ